jgi:regulatory protein
MLITKIVKQKHLNRYSIFIGNAYSFSLSERKLTDTRLHIGQNLTKSELAALKLSSHKDKLTEQTYRYVSMRARTEGEVEEYLKRHHVEPTVRQTIIDRLKGIGLLDDRKYTELYIQNRQQLKPSSRQRLILELRKKHVPEKIISSELAKEQDSDATTLRTLIGQKRRQPRYKDDFRLMKFLARQGFHYEDIKEALKSA